MALSIKVLVTAGCFIAGFFETATGQANFCGTSAPEPEKTCVTLRLPWQEEPIFFCTDKSKIRYRNQCIDHSVHCAEQWKSGSLLVATPWDCCPIASNPDPCSQTMCPPPPFNRTCKAIPLPEEHNPWDCCPKYFCDTSSDGIGIGSRKECSTKQLMPGCTSPPKGKTNCVGFRDEYSCCNQYQCDGDGKPGMCPMQIQAMKYSASQNPQQMSSPLSVKYGNANATNAHTDHSTYTSEQKSMGHMAMPAPSIPGGQGFGMPTMVHSPGYQNLQCVGDHTCPGTMKCCSNDINVYSDGTTISRNYHSTYGFCVEPM